MNSCQVKVFQTIAESPIPLTTNNLINMLPYSEDSIRKSITNLRKKGFIESTGYRYFLTDLGKLSLQNDPHSLTLDASIGSYVRAKSKLNGSAFIEFIIEEAEKTDYGRKFLSDVESISGFDPIISVLAPYVAYFAIQSGLITESRTYYGHGKTTPGGNFNLGYSEEEEAFQQALTEKYQAMGTLLRELVELYYSKKATPNGN